MSKQRIECDPKKFLTRSMISNPHQGNVQRLADMPGAEAMKAKYDTTIDEHWYATRTPKGDSSPLPTTPPGEEQENG